MIDQQNRTFSRRFAARGASFVILMLGAAALVSGCSHNQGQGNNGIGMLDSGSNDDSSGNFDSSNMKGTDVVATVNNEPITAGEMFDAMQHQVPAHMVGFPNNLQLGQPTGKIVLQNLIVAKLKMQIAKGQNAPVTQSDLDTAYQDFTLQQQAESTLPTQTFLAQDGYTTDQFKREVLAPQVAETNIKQKLVVISPEALEQAYKATPLAYTVPAALHIHRIVCATQNQAANVVKGIKAGQPLSDFLDDNIARGGQGGDQDDDTNVSQWLQINQLPAPLAKAMPTLKSAKTGDIIGPAFVGGGWWVVQVVEARPAQLLPYSQVQDVVRTNFINQMAGQNGVETMSLDVYQAMHTALIRVNIPAYQNLSQLMHEISIPNQSSAQVQGKTMAIPVPGKQ